MFGKAFSSMYTGSMVGAGLNVFAVWGYVIANARPDSKVELNPPLIAAVLGCSIGEVQAAIDVLCAPDPNSRSQKEEGRRLVREAAFLYSIPTYSDYRAMRDDGDRREYMRNYMRDYRKEKGLAPAAESAEPKPAKAKAKRSTPNCPHEDIIALYHELLPMCPSVRVFPDKARKHMQCRWAEDEARQNLDWWRSTFDYIKNNCPFLIGQKTDFRADLAWIVNPTNIAKILNGNYEVDKR